MFTCILQTQIIAKTCINCKDLTILILKCYLSKYFNLIVFIKYFVKLNM